jgi:TrmH family RNA methyltransferase
MADIESLDNGLVKQIVRLVNNRSYREEQGLCIIYGLHLVEEAYKYGVLKSILLDENHPSVELPYNIPVYTVKRNVMTKINLLDGHYDIVGIVEQKIGASNFNAENCIILDNIQDPGNLGTIIRSCKAGGVKNIILTNGCVDAYNSKVLRSSQGAVFGLNICVVDNIVEFVKKYSGTIIATSPYAKNSLYTAKLNSPIAWVFGNEGVGISKDLLNMIPTQVMIPMDNDTESINVAMAATVCLFEQLRQRLSQ